MDFTAQITFLTTEEGGREGYVLSGYRPHIKFENIEYLTSGQQIYPKLDRVYPGDSVFTEITMLSSKFFIEKLYEGQKFDIFEGSRKVGFGTIIKIHNMEIKIKKFS